MRPFIVDPMNNYPESIQSGSLCKLIIIIAMSPKITQKKNIFFSRYVINVQHLFLFFKKSIARMYQVLKNMHGLGMRSEFHSFLVFWRKLP